MGGAERERGRDRETEGMIEIKCRGGKGEKPESGEEKWREGGQSD